MLAVVLDIEPPLHINGYELGLIPAKVEVLEMLAGLTAGKPQFSASKLLEANYTGGGVLISNGLSANFLNFPLAFL